MTAGLKSELKETELQLLDREQDIRNLEAKIEYLEEEIREIEECLSESKMKSNAWCNDPDPYGYHGIPIVTRLEEMGYSID